MLYQALFNTLKPSRTVSPVEKKKISLFLFLSLSAISLFPTCLRLLRSSSTITAIDTDQALTVRQVLSTPLINSFYLYNNPMR